MKFLLVILILLSNQHVHDTSPPAVPKLWGLKPSSPNETMPARSIEWMQDAPKKDDLYWYVYRVYFDKETAGKQLGAPMCTGSYTPFQCSAPMPSITTTVGKHILRITASRFIHGDSVQHPSQTGQEAWSEPAEFMVRQPPPFIYVPTVGSFPPVIIR